MEKRISELRNQIVKFSDHVRLNDLGIPATEVNDFSRFMLVPQALLINAPWNYKDNDTAMDRKLSANLDNQGQTENINVRDLPSGMMEVGNGNHRNKIFGRKGREFVLVCNHGDISPEEFKRRCIEQNETKYRTDPDKLSSLIKEIEKKIPWDRLSLSMPFNDKELNRIINSGTEAVRSMVDTTSESLSSIQKRQSKAPTGMSKGDKSVGVKKVMDSDFDPDDDWSTVEGFQIIELKLSNEVARKWKRFAEFAMKDQGLKDQNEVFKMIIDEL